MLEFNLILVKYKFEVENYQRKTIFFVLLLFFIYFLKNYIIS